MENFSYFISSSYPKYYTDTLKYATKVHPEKSVVLKHKGSTLAG